MNGQTQSNTTIRLIDTLFEVILLVRLFTLVERGEIEIESHIGQVSQELDLILYYSSQIPEAEEIEASQ